MDALKVVTWRVPSANAAQLEAATLGADERPAVLNGLAQALGVRDIMYLGTCQRVLLVTLCEDVELGAVEKEAYSRFAQRATGANVPAPEAFEGERAFAHLCEVASSLDSLVPGEAQVLGQMKDAFQQAQSEGRIGKGLEHVFQLVFRTAKRVRTNTDLFKGKVSLIPLTLDAIDAALAQKERATVAIVGTGTIGAKMCELLRERPQRIDLHVVSRTRERAQEIAQTFNASAWTLADFLARTPACDLVVLATRAERAFFTPNHARAAAAASGTLVLDLSLPRNAEDGVRAVPATKLVALDELTALSHQAKQEREIEIQRAKAILETEIADVARHYASRHVDEEVVALRQAILDAAEERWQRAPLGAGADAEARKWYEQTVKHLVHVAQTHLRRDRGNEPK